MATELWPVHPVPQADETLASWVTRIARGNASSVSSWMAAVRGKYGNATQFDTTDDPELYRLLAERTGVRGGIDVVKSMTFERTARQFGQHAAPRWVLPVDERARRVKHGYCVPCLTSDASPYLRRAWRFEWVRWCPVHACRLERACNACGHHFTPWFVQWQRPFASCSECGCALSSSSPTDRAPPFVASAVRDALTLLSSDESDTLTFPLVWSLQKWVEAVGPELWPSWLSRLGKAAPHDASPRSQEDSVAWSFALAWHLAKSPADVLGTLVARHQASFNRATSTHCPPSLAALRHVAQPLQPLTAEQVQDAVDSVIASEMRLTYLAVAEMMGVSLDRVSRNHELRRVVDGAAPRAEAAWCERMRQKLGASQARLKARGRRLSRQQLAADAGVSLEAIADFERLTGETFAVSSSQEHADLVRRAIQALRERRERITTAAVARVLGRDRNFIEKNPHLKQLIRVARDVRPSVGDVERVCDELIARGETVTLLGVAKVFGCGRHVLERDQQLRRIVETKIKATRKEVETEIRGVVKALLREDAPVTIAAVCRSLGRHRSYVEKRGRLRDLVGRAKRSRAQDPLGPLFSRATEPVEGDDAGDTNYRHQCHELPSRGEQAVLPGIDPIPSELDRNRT